MKLYWKQNVYGWIMTGLVGRGAQWFFGFSRVPSNAGVQSTGLHSMAMEWQARAGRLEAKSDESMQASGSQLQECAEELLEALSAGATGVQEIGK